MIQYLTPLLKQRLQELSWSTEELRFTRPRDPRNGDWSTPIAMVLARTLRRPPMEIAKEIVSGLQFDPQRISKVEIAPPGFINFFQAEEWLRSQLKAIVEQGAAFGRSEFGQGRKAQVEFVSANPTGPLTVGHGRQTVLGDTLARVLEWSGYEVVREYYFNNAGRQMRLLGESLKARYLELKGETTTIPDGGYQGQYLVEIARKLLEQKPDLDRETPVSIFQKFAEEEIFKQIRNTLARLGVYHDVFYNEQSLYDEGKIQEVLQLLEDKGLLYRKDGAVWFKATQLGLEQDRVLVKSTGEPTYRLPDIAYHREKIRRGFDLIIDIFGADHLDTYPDVLAALRAMDLPTENIHVVIHQFVTLLRHGEIVKMSTRKGDFITLDDLIDEVGPDVVRYFYLMRSANSHLNFDLDLARRQTEENPVFYLQYAHARIASVFRKAQERGIQLNIEVNLALLKEPETRQLMDQAVAFPHILDRCRQTFEVHHLPNYLYELATSFHKFYTEYQVLGPDPQLTQARLFLLKAVQIVLQNGLSVMGISAPDRM